MQSCLQDVLVECRHHVLLDRARNSLERLVSLALGIVVLHVLHRSEGGLDRDVEASVTGIGDGLADSGSNDIRLSVLQVIFR